MTSFDSSDFYRSSDTDPLASPGRVRKKLQLKPRSNQQVTEPPLSPRSKSNPFGAAKPREQVLRQRGIDPKSFDAKFEQKAKVSRFSSGQEEQIEAVRQELTRLEALWRDANEKELPEEVFRLQAEAKREELKNLMNRFSSKEDGFTPVTRRSSKQHHLSSKEKPEAHPVAAMPLH